MVRILCKGIESPLNVTSGAASSFSEATVVRLANLSTTADHLVTVVETQGGNVIGSFTMLRGTSEFLEKNPSHCVFAADAAVVGAKVGFTG